MAKRKLATRINLLSTLEVLSGEIGEKKRSPRKQPRPPEWAEYELSDGGGLILRLQRPTAGSEISVWVFRYTATSSKRREMGLGVCYRQNAQAAGKSLSRAREAARNAREMLASIPPVDPIDERARKGGGQGSGVSREGRQAKHCRYAGTSGARLSREIHRAAQKQQTRRRLDSFTRKPHARCDLAQADCGNHAGGTVGRPARSAAPHCRYWPPRAPAASAVAFARASLIRSSARRPAGARCAVLKTSCAERRPTGSVVSLRCVAASWVSPPGCAGRHIDGSCAKWMRRPR